MVGLVMLLATTGLTYHVQASKGTAGTVGAHPATSGPNCYVWDANGNLALAGTVQISTPTLLSCVGTTTGNGHTPVLITNAQNGGSCGNGQFGWTTTNYANVVSPNGAVTLLCQAGSGSPES